jgi:A/G-specific adenine glycosylase
MEMNLKRDSSSRKFSTRTSFFNKTLLEWFDSNGRNFPWRFERDPFRILIAEIMLQRTRAQQVVPVYLDFLKRFPNLRSAISAGSREIRPFISRLGLYWRTGLIIKMMHEINRKYDGMIPDERNDLRALPGVGDYISEALMVFGFDRKATVIDANVVRLVSRFFGISAQGEVRRKKDFIKLCQTLVDEIPPEKVKSFNWALIDLPAIICIRNPRCHLCPLARRCSYFANNLKVGARK